MNQDKEMRKKEIKNEVAVLVKEKEFNTAYNILESKFNLFKNDVEAYILKSLSLIGMGKFKESEIILRNGLSIEKDNYLLNYKLGYVYEGLGRGDHPLYYYNKAYNLSTDESIKVSINKLINNLKENSNLNLETIKKEIKNQEYNKIKKVLFIQSIPCMRTNNVAKALWEKGVQVDMLYLAINPSEIHKDCRLPYTNIYRLFNTNEIVFFINNSDYDVLYSSNEPDYLTVVLSSTNKPIIHDTHELMSIKSKLTIEQQALEYSANVNAAGNVYINPQTRDLAIEKFDLDKNPILSLYSYLTREQLPKEYFEKLSSKDGEIHCVYAGHIVNDPSHYNNLEPFFIELANNRIHVHLYCVQDTNYIRNLCDKYKYIHNEGSVFSHNLITEMTKYDIALAMFNVTSYNEIYLNTVFPSEIWSYLAATLPIMFSKLECFAKFISNNNIGKLYDVNIDIKEQLEEIGKIEIPRDLLEKNHWFMEQHSEELIDFFIKVKEKRILNSCLE